MLQFFDNAFSKCECRFQKNFSTQQCLLAILEKLKRSADNGKAFPSLLMNSSKVFDCLDHELLLRKLDAYCFSLSALKIIHHDQSNSNQQMKINSSDSSWHEIILGYHKVLFYGFCCLISFQSICFLQSKTLILLVIQMEAHHT